MYEEEDCFLERTKKGTPGGTTYFVIPPGKDEAVAICFRPIRARRWRGQGFVCEKSAGWKTDHPGTGACKHHGGLTTEHSAIASITTGRYAIMTKSRLKDRIDSYLHKDRSALLDLTNELANARAVYDEFMENFPDPKDREYGIMLHRFQTLIGTIGVLVEKQTKIDSRNTITAAQVLYLKACVADILMKYVPLEAREQAIGELQSRIGGSEDKRIILKPYEVRKNEQF